MLAMDRPTKNHHPRDDHEILPFIVYHISTPCRIFKSIGQRESKIYMGLNRIFKLQSFKRIQIFKSIGQRESKIYMGLNRKYSKNFKHILGTQINACTLASYHVVREWAQDGDQALPLRPSVRWCTMDKRAILVVSRLHHGLDVEIMESAAATIIVRSRSIVIWTIDGVQRVCTPQVGRMRAKCVATSTQRET
jgi:hypothetical protein